MSIAPGERFYLSFLVNRKKNAVRTVHIATGHNFIPGNGTAIIPTCMLASR